MLETIDLAKRANDTLAGLVAKRPDRIALLAKTIEEGAQRPNPRQEALCWIAADLLAAMKAEGIDKTAACLATLANKRIEEKKDLHTCLHACSRLRADAARQVVIDILKNTAVKDEERRLAAHYAGFFPDAALEGRVRDLIDAADQGFLWGGADYTLATWFERRAAEADRQAAGQEHEERFAKDLASYSAKLQRGSASIVKRQWQVGELEKFAAELHGLRDRMTTSAFVLGVLEHKAAATPLLDALGFLVETRNRTYLGMDPDCEREAPVQGLRGALAEALGKLGEKKALPLVIQLLSAKVKDADLGPPPMFQDFPHDQDIGRGLGALRLLADASARPVLETYARHKNLGYRQAAEGILKELERKAGPKPAETF